VLDDNAAIDLYNLTPSPLTVRVTLRGLAVSGSKQVRASNGALRTFAMNQFAEWLIGDIALAPGLTNCKSRTSVVHGSHFANCGSRRCIRCAHTNHAEPDAVGC